MSHRESTALRATEYANTHTHRNYTSHPDCQYHFVTHSKHAAHQAEKSPKRARRQYRANFRPHPFYLPRSGNQMDAFSRGRLQLHATRARVEELNMVYFRNSTCPVGNACATVASTKELAGSRARAREGRSLSDIKVKSPSPLCPLISTIPTTHLFRQISGFCRTSQGRDRCQDHGE